MAAQKAQQAEQAGKALKIDVKTPAGKTEGSVELPAELFDAPRSEERRVGKECVP